MRKYILVSVIAIIAFFVGNALGSSTPHLDQYVQNSITPWMLKNKIPGLAVELYVDGVPHSYYFGVANRDKKILLLLKLFLRWVRLQNYLRVFF